MREILFCGKRIDNGKWAEGFLVISDKRYFILPVEKIDACYFDWLKKGEYVFGRFVEVIPDTIGQFTGLTDRNGMRIFEGNIIRHYNRSNHPSEYDTYKIEFDMRGCMWVGRYNNNYAAQLRDYLGEHYEIIGNIHDNPQFGSINA